MPRIEYISAESERGKCINAYADKKCPTKGLNVGTYRAKGPDYTAHMKCWRDALDEATYRVCVDLPPIVLVEDDSSDDLDQLLF